MAQAPQAFLHPNWLAHRYDPDHDAVHFINADRAMRRKVPFLTDDFLPTADSPVVVRRVDALAANKGAKRIGFIFHSAYCCSTLLANAFDRPGAAVGIKEPIILNDLVGWRLRGGAPDRIGAILRDALELLARPFEAGEIAIIKPSNVVNGLAPAMISARPEAGVLLIHAPLKTYLASIANKGLRGRLWVRELLTKQLKEGLVDFGFSSEDIFNQSDLQIAAIGWLAQHRLFTKIATTWPARVRTVSSEELLAHPRDALTALDKLFGVASDPAALDEVIDTVFRRHAKSGETFTSENRMADQRSALQIHGEEISLVYDWAKLIAEQAAIAFDLPNPLIVRA